MNEDGTALVALGLALREAGYHFVTVTPSTHRRVDSNASAGGVAKAQSVRDVFGWSRPFERDLLPAALFALAERAGVIETKGELFRATVRFSSLESSLFVHSAHPTDEADAVFFGPDTYRFFQMVKEEMTRVASCARMVEIGCGSGAVGIAMANRVDRVVLSDVSARALRFASVNAAIANVERGVDVLESDVLAGIDGPIDVIIANPPYLVDAARRTYRNGGGLWGEALGVRMVSEAVGRLNPGGRLILYTGAPVVDGVDCFLQAVRPSLEGFDLAWHYRELDPDVFGEEIDTNAAYATVERIAAVSLVVELPA